MLDIRMIRDNPDLCREGLIKVQADPALIDQVLDLDSRRREALHGLESRRAERTRRSKEIGKLPPEERKAAGASVSSLAQERGWEQRSGSIVFGGQRSEQAGSKVGQEPEVRVPSLELAKMAISYAREMEQIV